MDARTRLEVDGRVSAPPSDSEQPTDDEIVEIALRIAQEDADLMRRLA